MTEKALIQLTRKWIHSFEEDNDEEQVYRPADFPFKRARGRNQFELKENGHVNSFQIGKNDVPEQIMGFWQTIGNKLTITLDDGTTQVFPVIDVDENRLVVKK